MCLGLSVVCLVSNLLFWNSFAPYSVELTALNSKHYRVLYDKLDSTL